MCCGTPGGKFGYTGSVPDWKYVLATKMLFIQVIDRLLSKRRNKEAEPLYITQGREKPPLHIHQLKMFNSIHLAYGLTESTGASHYVYHEDSAHLVGAVGKLLPSIECRLVQEGSDIDAPEGQPGEIWLRGPTIMKVSHTSTP